MHERKGISIRNPALIRKKLPLPDDEVDTLLDVGAETQFGLDLPADKDLEEAVGTDGETLTDDSAGHVSSDTNQVREEEI